MLIVFVVRGVTLDGAGDGIKFYLEPDLSRLRDPQVQKQLVKNIQVYRKMK